MTILGHGHFAVPLETLPEEKVLWEGGAARAGTWIRLARMLGVPAFFFGMWLLLFVPIIALDAMKPDRACSDTTQTDCTPGRTSSGPARDAKAATSLPADPAAPAAKKAPPQEERSFLGPLLTLATSAGLLLLGLLSYAWLKRRHAWYVVTSERICIQSGALTRSLTVIDLDKVLSVQVSSSLLERWAGVQSIEFVHAGGGSTPANAWAALLMDNYKMNFVPTDPQLVSNLLNHWLPRDDHRRA